MSSKEINILKLAESIIKILSIFFVWNIYTIGIFSVTRMNRNVQFPLIRIVYYYTTAIIERQAISSFKILSIILVMKFTKMLNSTQFRYQVFIFLFLCIKVPCMNVKKNLKIFRKFLLKFQTFKWKSEHKIIFCHINNLFIFKIRVCIVYLKTLKLSSLYCVINYVVKSKQYCDQR